MQLRTLVLPAPLGPISANNSPGETVKDTSSSAVSPLNRRRKCCTDSSAIPPPRSAILLDVAVGAALTAGLTEVKFLHILMAFKTVAITIEHYASVFHDVCVICDLQRGGSALLDKQDGDA